MWFCSRRPKSLGSIWASTLSVVFVGGLASGCVRTQAAKEPPETLTPAEAKAVDEYRAEVEIGRNMAGRLLAYYGVVDSPKLLGYLNQLGSYVASYSDYPDRRYMFAILKHESVNAFACPGGYILVTMGAIRNARNEAELAMVLGHEITHVGKKHMFDALKKMKEADLKKAADARKLDNFPASMKVRERPVAESTAFGSKMAQYISGSSGASLNILVAAQAGMTLLTEKGLGKDLEFEADHEGVKYAIRAGYEPQALIQYLKRLESAKNEKKVKNLEKTHPPLPERIKRIAALLKTLKADEIIGATGQQRFARERRNFPKAERD